MVSRAWWAITSVKSLASLCDIALLALLPIFVGGCANLGVLDLFSDKPVSKDALSQYNQQKQENAPKKATGKRVLYIKSRIFNYYDYATFAVNKKQEIFIELFAGGKTIGTLEVNKRRICILKDCARKWPVAKEFFGKVSYGDLFDDIFFQRDIFGGVGKVIERDGALVQRFQKNGEIIYYRRTKDGVLFKNMSNGVIVSLHKYQEPRVPKELEEEA